MDNRIEDVALDMRGNENETPETEIRSIAEVVSELRQTEQSASAQIKCGIYTIVYPSGEHRTLRVKEWKREGGNPAVVVGFLSGRDNESDYTYFGFLREDNGINFFRSFKSGQTPERLARIAKAVKTIAGDPKAAGLAYALQSSRCCRCNRTLTVPASIHNGMGPECASRE